MRLRWERSAALAAAGAALFLLWLADVATFLFLRGWPAGKSLTLASAWSERIALAGFLLVALFLSVQILRCWQRDRRGRSDKDRHLHRRASMDLQVLGHLLLMLVLLFVAVLFVLYAFDRLHGWSQMARLPLPARLGVMWLLLTLAGFAPNAAALWISIKCPSKDCRGRAYLRSLKPVLYQCRACGSAHAMSLSIGGD